jgi:hypothetical protein
MAYVIGGTFATGSAVGGRQEAGRDHAQTHPAPDDVFFTHRQAGGGYGDPPRRIAVPSGIVPVDHAGRGRAPERPLPTRAGAR